MQHAIFNSFVVCFGLLYRYGRKIGGKRLAEIPSDAEAMNSFVSAVI